MSSEKTFHKACGRAEQSQNMAQYCNDCNILNVMTLTYSLTDIYLIFLYTMLTCLLLKCRKKLFNVALKMFSILDFMSLAAPFFLALFTY